MLDMWMLLVLMPVIVLVFRSRGILTERVVAHPNILSSFRPPTFVIKGGSQATFAEMEFTLLETELCVPYRSRFMCLMM